MCDFAPRDTYNIHDAIRDANIKLAGLYGYCRVRVRSASAFPDAESSSAPADSTPARSPAGVAVDVKAEDAP